MTSTQTFGLIITIIGGLLMGGGGFMIKWMPQYSYEQMGFISMLVGLIVCPWIVTLTFCPHAIAALRSVDSAVLIKSNLFSLVWGVANALYFISLLRIGFSLTIGIFVGVSVPIGVITPMLIKASGLFSTAPSPASPAGLIVMAGAALMIAGVVFVVLSGLGRDRALNRTTTNSRRLGIGLLLAVIASVLSVGNNFSYVYSQGPIIAAMRAHGAGEIPANFAVWAVGLGAGGLINVLIPVWIMTKKRSWGVLLAHPVAFFLSVALGAEITGDFFVMGKGMLLLGALGASVGFGVNQAMKLIGGQIVGFVWGEWKGVLGTPRRQIAAAVVILIVACAVMAMGLSYAPRA